MRNVCLPEKTPRRNAVSPPCSSSVSISLALALASLFLIFPGCIGTHIAPLEEKLTARHFEFLHQGESTLQEIFDRLGIPDSSYESGLVITYRIGKDSEGKMFVANAGSKIRTSSLYELVLVFGRDHLLEKYSLVRKW